MQNRTHKEIEICGFGNVPEPITTDRRGTRIMVGDLVAFNRSGTIQRGEIVSFKAVYKDDRHYNWRLHFTMEILCEDGKTSTLKNPNSFMII